MTLYSIPPLLSLVCFTFLAIVVLARKKMTTVNTLFFLLCMTGIFLHADILILFTVKSRETALWSSRIDHLFAVYAIPLYIHFFHAYLNIDRRRWLIYTAYAVAFVLMWFSLTPLCIEKMNLYEFGYFGSGGRLYPVIGVGAAVASLYSLAIICLAIKREQNSVQKNKLKYILTGFGVMGFLNGLNVLPLLGYAFLPSGYFQFHSFDHFCRRFVQIRFAGYGNHHTKKPFVFCSDPAFDLSLCDGRNFFESFFS